MPHGDELEVRLSAVQPALAPEPARAHRDGRLDDVVAGAERIGGRVEKREHALTLIAMEEAPADRQCGQPDGGERAEHAPAEAGEEDDREAGGAAQRRGGSVTPPSE